MNIDDVELTLLEARDIWSMVKNGMAKDWEYVPKNEEYVIASITDLVMLTGGRFYKESDVNSRYLNRAIGYFYTGSSDNNYVVSVFGNHRFPHTSCSDQSGVIRPVLKSASVLRLVYPNGVQGTGEFKEVEFGEYPQFAASSFMQKKLEWLYQRGKLSTTGNDYTFSVDKSKTYDNLKLPFELQKYEEYEYNGKKYIRVQARAVLDKSPEYTLSNGLKVKYGDYVWVEVSPVKWLIDGERLISKMGLVSGIRFNNSRYYEGYFKSTEMYSYLNQYMKKDLLQEIVKNKEEENTSVLDDNKKNAKSEEISNKVDEIASLVMDDDKDGVKEEVTNLIEEYNKNLKRLLLNNSNDGLVFENIMTEDGLYFKLLSDLDDILNRLKNKKEKYSEYLLMLALVESCISVLKKEDKEDIVSDDIVDDISNIKNVILPFLNDNKKDEELLNIFLEEEKNIKDYLSGNDDNSISECKTLEEFKIKIRKKLQPFLVDIDSDVRSKKLIEEIREGYSKICSGIFENDREDYVTNLLEEVNKLVKEIELKGNDSDQKKLNKILNKELSFNDKELFDSINKIRDLYKKLYVIMLGINERRINNEKVDDYTVTVDGINK